jgi:hypothetical protein
MTGDFVRKLGGLVCLVAVFIIGVGFLVGAKSMLSTMKGPEVVVEATDEEAAELDEAASEEVDEGYEDEDDYDE